MTDCLVFPQVTCTHGFSSMEDCHVKVVEELQRRHQQEAERLLVERDRLLEEESAATATGEGAGQLGGLTGCEFPSNNASLCCVASQRSRPSRTPTVWSWRGRCRGDGRWRRGRETLAWRTFTDNTGASGHRKRALLSGASSCPETCWNFLKNEACVHTVTLNPCLSVCACRVQRGADLPPEGAPGSVAAVLPPLPGERTPGPGAGRREEGLVSVPAGEPGPQNQEPGGGGDWMGDAPDTPK